MRQLYLKKKFGFDCKCSVCCGDVDGQESILEKLANIILSPDYEVLTLCDSPKKYDTSLEQWKRMAIKGAIMVTLTRKLHIGSVPAKISNYTCAVRAAQMARVQVLLERAMDAWKELVMATGFVYWKLGYEQMKATVTKWTPEFVSKKPPTQEEIDAFYVS